jgi:YcaO-like protein with predicted kinase domain
MTTPTPTTTKRHRRGTHRACPPAETWARIAPLAPAAGVTRVADVTGLDTVGIPVALAIRPASRSVAVAAGKGLTQTAARVSALMESLESFHAERVDRPLTTATFRDLARDGATAVLDPARLPQPRMARWHPDLPLRWIAAADLATGARTWLPYEVVHTDFRWPPPPDAGCFAASSNGLAAGNTRPEAIVHALCELIERDANALWGARGEDDRRARRIDLATIINEDACALLDRYAAARVGVAVWETTTDAGVPAFLCAAVDDDLDPFRPLPAAGGAGCHPDRTVALLRALTEAAQTRVTMIAGSRDDITIAAHAAMLDPVRRHDERAIVRDGGAGGGRPFDDGPPGGAGASAEDDLAWLRARLAAVGVDQVVVVDLTRPDLDLPVVRVVAPGLEGLPQPGTTPGPRLRRMLAP